VKPPAGGEGDRDGDAQVEAQADPAGSFEPHRRYLRGIAYRMLGSIAEAEDIVQEAFLRWNDVERSSVGQARPYLARTVTRLCLDHLKTARAQRERYVGTWLPEPLIDQAGPDVSEGAALADDLSVALLMTLERLSPLERAAFLLHDVFEMDYPAIAGVLERSEVACRQLAARARAHVREEKPRFQPPEDAGARLQAAFQTAITVGDLDGLARLLAEDAVFYSDGGGKRPAALKPIFGRDRIVRFLRAAANLPGPLHVEATRINGLPGFIVRGPHGVETLALEVREPAPGEPGPQIVAIYGIRNPDKLRHLEERGAPS
jgi:RNA polymerase sigma-70 factor, ECF subfamily